MQLTDEQKQVVVQIFDGMIVTHYRSSWSGKYFKAKTPTGENIHIPHLTLIMRVLIRECAVTWDEKEGRYLATASGIGLK